MSCEQSVNVSIISRMTDALHLCIPAEYYAMPVAVNSCINNNNNNNNNNSNNFINNNNNRKHPKMLYIKS